ncbi:GNAT family N-acetyltransferase [Paramicrobacterium agarici]|uniref:GNAT family N-acetyltransferase n=1 Tax=Paramicrobacterium agarici TaxID=630514 RepID=UPI0011524674|nr:GNAT family N-acetyltransferase [Microbacterium agarici]TQO23687.1 acetyltransferase (GNAT) family protein [Microbacterium agarici]
MTGIEVRDSDPRWLPSLYFGRDYGNAYLQEGEGDRWISLSSSTGDWQMPLFLRRLENDVFDACSPYGYSGLYVAKSVDPIQSLAHWTEARRLLRGLGVVSLFLRMSPFLDQGLSKIQTMPGLDVRAVSETVLVPVADIKATWAGMKGRARTAIRKAERSGFTGAVHPTVEASLSAGASFRRLYEQTMHRVEAGEQYIYSDAYYEALRSGLDGTVQEVVVKDQYEVAVASALLLVDNECGHYHLSGSNPQAARDGANNLLIWTILQWCHDHGKTAVHLGGGLKSGDNLFRFKASFGGQTLPFFTGRSIVQPVKYADLVSHQARRLDVSELELANQDFFPAYRAVVQ